MFVFRLITTLVIKETKILYRSLFNCVNKHAKLSLKTVYCSLFMYDLLNEADCRPIIAVLVTTLSTLHFSYCYATNS